MRRREFIAGLGSAAAWSFAVRAQQAERVRPLCEVLTPAAGPGEATRCPVHG
jgi:hypothetical protein